MLLLIMKIHQYVYVSLHTLKDYLLAGNLKFEVVTTILMSPLNRI